MIQIDARNITWDLGKDVTYEILIANLGGYESAKSKLRDNGSLHAERLKKALLEYRRQHNIFELGDKVVLAKSYSLDTVHEIKRIENLTPHIKDSETTYFLENSLGCWSFQIKHATDAEIAAGKRLEVS